MGVSTPGGACGWIKSCKNKPEIVRGGSILGRGRSPGSFVWLKWNSSARRDRRAIESLARRFGHTHTTRLLLDAWMRLLPKLDWKIRISKSMDRPMTHNQSLFNYTERFGARLRSTQPNRTPQPNQHHQRRHHHPRQPSTLGRPWRCVRPRDPAAQPPHQS